MIELDVRSPFKSNLNSPHLKPQITLSVHQLEKNYCNINKASSGQPNRALITIMMTSSKTVLGN